LIPYKLLEELEELEELLRLDKSVDIPLESKPEIVIVSLL
jgi:hypothetical protein